MKISGFFLAALLCHAASTQAAPAAENRLLVMGSTTVLPVASLAAEEFTRRSGREVSITINPGGSGVGVNSAATGRASIGMISREISSDEHKRFAEARLKTHVIGHDRVACVVSSEIYQAGVQSLSREEIRAIYQGTITNWKEVGGPDREIVVVDKERHRGTRHAFMRYVFGDPTARAPGARLVTGSNNEEQAKIAASDAAVGMLSTAWISDEVAGVGIREGQAVLFSTDASQTAYPIVRPLSLVTAGEPAGLAREFIEFMLAPAGQALVENFGYYPVAAADRVR